MFEFERGDLKAVWKWNCTQFRNRAVRVMKYRVFHAWKCVTEDAITQEISKIQTEITKQRESLASVRIERKYEVSKPTSSNTNAQLKAELAALQREQKRLEEETTRVKDELSRVSRNPYANRSKASTTLSRAPFQ